MGMDRKIKAANPEMRRELNRLWDRATVGDVVAPVEASKTLTFSAPVVLGASVLVGEDKYVFAMSEEDILEGEFLVDVSSDVVFATGTLTIETQPTADDTVTIGDVTYKFVASPAVAGDIKIEGDGVATTIAGLVTAINDGDALNEPHPDVEISNFVANEATVTALVAGTVGNAIVFEATFAASGDNSASGIGFLVDGADCPASDAGEALEVAVTANDDSLVSADNTAGAVEFEALVAGADMNGFTIVFEAGGMAEPVVLKLAGGVDGTVGYAGDIIIDTGDVYISVADSTIAVSNWKKITLAGS